MFKGAVCKKILYLLDKHSDEWTHDTPDLFNNGSLLSYHARYKNRIYIKFHHAEVGKVQYRVSVNDNYNDLKLNWLEKRAIWKELYKIGNELINKDKVDLNKVFLDDFRDPNSINFVKEDK